MHKNIDLFTKRYLQITMVFMLFKYLELYWHIPRGNWITITGALIYIGFNTGTVIKRAYLRFIGTITGIAAVVIIWHLVHIDYRLAIFFLIAISWAMIFFQGLSYEHYTIIGVMFSDINLELSNTLHFSLQDYLIDRFITTMIVFGVCIIVEQLYFGKSNLSVLNCQHLLKNIEDELWDFFKIVRSKKMTQAILLKKIKQSDRKLLELKELIEHFKYENTDFYAHFEPVFYHVRHLFRKIVCLGYLQLHHQEPQQITQVIREIENELQNNKISQLI